MKKRKNKILKTVKDLRAKTVGWISEHKLLFFICLMTFACDIYFNRILIFQSLVTLSAWMGRFPFLLYCKNCAKGIYDLRATMLGMSISVSSLYFAAISFMYNNFKESSFGILISDIYMWKYGEQLDKKREVLLEYTPFLIVALIMNWALLAFVLFGCLLFEFFSVLRRMVLIFEKKEQQNIIKNKLMTELLDYQPVKDNKSVFPNLKKIIYGTKKQPDAYNFLLEVNDCFLDSISGLSASERGPAEPASYYSAYYEMTTGLLVSGKALNEGISGPEDSYVLKFLEQIGLRIKNTKADEETVKYLSADLGIITAAINYYRNDSTVLFDQLFDAKNAAGYWPGYADMIVGAVSLLLELFYEKRIIIEPLTSYLIEKKMLFSHLKYTQLSDKAGRRSQMLLLLCTNYSSLKEFSYIDVLRVYALLGAEQDKNLKPCACRSYLGVKGLWRYEYE